MFGTDVPFQIIIADFFVLAATSQMLGVAETIHPPSEYERYETDASSI